MIVVLRHAGVDPLGGSAEIGALYIVAMPDPVGFCAGDTLRETIDLSLHAAGHNRRDVRRTADIRDRAGRHSQKPGLFRADAPR